MDINETEQIFQQFSQDTFSIQTGIRELMLTENLKEYENLVDDIDAMVLDLNEIITNLQTLRNA